jgi:hypothetical protein
MTAIRRIALALGLTLVCLPLAVPPAGANVTIGSSLSSTANAGAICDPGTCSQKALPGGLAASPVNGVIRTWRFVWSGPGNARLRVIRPMAPNALFLSSSAVAPVVSAPTMVPVAIPISLGDRIGIDDLGGSNAVGHIPATGATMDYWTGTPPADGSSPPPTFTDPGFELFLNADVEPTNDAKTMNLKMSRRKGTATLIEFLPNPGTLVISEGPIKPRTIQADQPGLLQLKLKPNKRALTKLLKRGKVKGGIDLIFTPSFGSPSRDTITVVLHLKR